MTDTTTEAGERLIALIREHLQGVEAEAARLGNIKATIRVNAARHGATDAEIEAFLSGEASFIEWMGEAISGPQSALAAERDVLAARVAKLEAAAEKHLIPAVMRFGASGTVQETEYANAALAAYRAAVQQETKP